MAQPLVEAFDLRYSKTWAVTLDRSSYRSLKESRAGSLCKEENYNNTKRLILNHLLAIWMFDS